MLDDNIRDYFAMMFTLRIYITTITTSNCYQYNRRKLVPLSFRVSIEKRIKYNKSTDWTFRMKIIINSNNNFLLNYNCINIKFLFKLILFKHEKNLSYI